jgi:hypothetical protein
MAAPFVVGFVATVPTGTAEEPPLFSAHEFNRFWDIPLISSLLSLRLRVSAVRFFVRPRLD